MKTTSTLLLIITSFFIPSTLHASQPKPDAQKTSSALSAAQPQPKAEKNVKVLSIHTIRKALESIKREPDLSLEAYKKDLDLILKDPQKARATSAHLKLQMFCFTTFLDLWKTHDKIFFAKDNSSPQTRAEVNLAVKKIVETLPKENIGHAVYDQIMATFRASAATSSCSPQGTALISNLAMKASYRLQALKEIPAVAADAARYKQLSVALKGQPNEEELKRFNDDNYFHSLLADYLKDPHGKGRIRYLQLHYYYRMQQKRIIEASIAASPESEGSKAATAGSAVKGLQAMLKPINAYLTAADKALADAEQNLKGAAEKSQSASTATAAASAQDTATAAAKK